MDKKKNEKYENFKQKVSGYFTKWYVRKITTLELKSHLARLISNLEYSDKEKGKKYCDFLIQSYRLKTMFEKEHVPVEII